MTATTVMQPISTHAPRTGSDQARGSTRQFPTYFNPRSPHGERRAEIDGHNCYATDFNPRSPHGERHYWYDKLQKINLFQPTLPARGATRFSKSSQSDLAFQPTLPARGATIYILRHCVFCNYFNPRSPHGERPKRKGRVLQYFLISTHAPRTGSDRKPSDRLTRCGRFQPTLPARGATSWTIFTRRAASNFNPRSPHGERLGALEREVRMLTFQPTLPARGATAAVPDCKTCLYAISTHAPRTGSDSSDSSVSVGASISTHAPRTGSDEIRARHHAAGQDISTHAPRTGSDFVEPDSFEIYSHFNPRSPHGERRARNALDRLIHGISTHAPRTGSDA